ncbi:glutathione S-transferase family protein [Alteromonas aestuariivivens]|uniref:Glutathione S-transferase family protein n=1 Tax=Alteromonas aestuariivivens TaxID=1938339 RepID=A0A3D8M563_9ALTE|nr:glutathione S-transferase family protein [Alteromonas aestuariivivens]RDV24806.1 glutathione S-transferase family protein [Alteromonas aestuariivivens]
MQIYGDKRSGNCYKIQLLLALLGKSCEWIDIDLLAGDSRTPAFLNKNPNGKIPLLELDDGRTLAESNAILNYIGSGSSLIPSSAFDQAQMLQWQFFEQYSHEPYIAVARYINLYLGLPDERKSEYESKQDGGHKALSVMEQRLASSLYLVGNQLSLADISLFAYTHVAHQGGFDLIGYPAIRNWISLIKDHKGFVPMAV